MQQMKAWGLQNVHLEKWPVPGYGWQIKKFYGALETPSYAPLTGVPLAWTPGTNGQVTAEAMWAPIHSKDDFAKYKGQLKGKIVLIFRPGPAHGSTRRRKQCAVANGRGGCGARQVESARRRIRRSVPAGAGSAASDRDPSGRGRHGEGTWEYTPTSLALSGPKNQALRNELNAFLKEEAPAVILTPGYNGDGGTIFSTYGGSENPNDPVPPPMVSIGAEQSTNRVRPPAAARRRAQAHVRRPGRVSKAEDQDAVNVDRRDSGDHEAGRES